MKKLLIAAIAVLVVVGGLMADGISPWTESRNLLTNDSNDKDTLVLPTAWYYSTWYPGFGEMSEGTLEWIISGDGSGSIDSIMFRFQWCFKSNYNGTLPDTTYLTVWDTFYTVTINDSIGWHQLNNYVHLGANTGWPPIDKAWFRMSAYNFDSDTADLHFCEIDLAGSQ